ncbi:chromosome segregation ATPase [Aeromonas diversa CDC 2478-85]|uniref:Chromosome segregation ATPase n=2 Tax=Aeromonas diversa TaxID=502790 RepID=N9TW30_9GAMM|nr:chromosome segregation ATPase [Aeromonas diversa CDC 2478-85]
MDDLASGEASQKKVAQVADAAVIARQELQAAERQLKDLTSYNQYMQGMVADQERELTTLQNQLNEVELTRQGLVPLLLKMQSDLETWVASDLPLRSTDRAARLQTLKETLARADVSEAEKFRVLLQAYQVEAEYGSRLDVWQQHLTLEGTERLVDVVALGRIALLAMTTDGSGAWRWSAEVKAWQPLDAAWHDAIGQAIALAKEKQTPSLLTLPLSTARQEISQ